MLVHICTNNYPGKISVLPMLVYLLHKLFCLDQPIGCVSTRAIRSVETLQ